MCAKKINPKIKLNILVIEDEEDVSKLYASILTKEGHRVVTASTGGQGIEKMEKEIFDLVILDLRLPDIDGAEVLKQIRQKNNLISVIIATAYPSLETALDAIKTRVDDYIIKPFSSPQLRLVVQKMAERMRLVRENERLLNGLKKKNKTLEENVDKLETVANAATAREKELEQKIQQLETELEKLKGLNK